MHAYILQNEDGDVMDPTVLIPSLMEQFYRLGWCSGTGGGISIRNGVRHCICMALLLQSYILLGDQIVIAPSGVQKERLKSHHFFFRVFHCIIAVSF